MPYSVQILECDWNFLTTCSDIPDAERVALLERCQEALANIADASRDDSAARIAPNRFRFQYVFQAENKALYALRFLVDESAMPYGVLRVLYVDVVGGKPLPRLDSPTSEIG